MAEYIIDKIEYGGNVYKLQDSVSDFLTGAVTALSTTEGQHSTITNQNGAVSIAIPTKTSHLTNDEGFLKVETDPVFTTSAAAGITATDISNWNAKADSDVNVTNTAVTAATTYYLTGSTSLSTATGGLSKHAAIKAYVTANTGTGGSARIDLGNTTATTSAGGKEGIIRLYGTSATYYVELKAGAPSANRTISFPNKAGTVALTTDIPTVSYPVTSVNNKTGAVSLSASDVGALPSTTAIPSKTSDLTNDSGFLTSYTETDPTVPSWAKADSKPSYTAVEVGAMSTSHAANAITSTDISNWNAKSDFSGAYNDLTDKPTIPTKTSELTNDSGFITGGNWLPLSGGTVTGATTFESSVGAASLSVSGTTALTGNLSVSTINGVTVGSSPKFTDTVTTATTSGSGNAVTAVSASNGALTITKGTNFQPAVTYSTTDLTAGSSSLTTGQIYLVYE